MLDPQVYVEVFVHVVFATPSCGVTVIVVPLKVYALVDPLLEPHVQLLVEHTLLDVLSVTVCVTVDVPA